ncbi:MAG: hypothetical protein ACEPOZ_21400 [Marinifilaceae bacterium]
MRGQKTNKTSLYTAIAITLHFNIDTIINTNTLWENDNIRKNLVAISGQFIAFADSTEKEINQMKLNEILIALNTKRETMADNLQLEQDSLQKTTIIQSTA